MHAVCVKNKTLPGNSPPVVEGVAAFLTAVFSGSTASWGKIVLGSLVMAFSSSGSKLIPMPTVIIVKPFLVSSSTASGSGSDLLSFV